MIQEFLVARLARGAFGIGQVWVTAEAGETIGLCHVADRGREDLEVHVGPDAALEIAKYDDAWVYRPLKTAPNLRRGWVLRLTGVTELRMALDFFYPAAIGTLVDLERGSLRPVPLRETLGRQTGMYRITQLLNDEQAMELNRTLCNSETGCLRRVLWELAPGQSVPLTESVDDVRAGMAEETLPVACVEACNLLVAAARPLGKLNLPVAKE